MDLKKVKISKYNSRVVVFFDEDKTLDNFNKEHNKIQFSRIPVYSKQIDNITGYIFIKDYIEKISSSKNLNKS